VDHPYPSQRLDRLGPRGRPDRRRVGADRAVRNAARQHQVSLEDGDPGGREAVGDGAFERPFDRLHVARASRPLEVGRQLGRAGIPSLRGLGDRDPRRPDPAQPVGRVEGAVGFQDLDEGLERAHVVGTPGEVAGEGDGHRVGRAPGLKREGAPVGQGVGTGDTGRPEAVQPGPELDQIARRGRSGRQVGEDPGIVGGRIERPARIGRLLGGGRQRDQEEHEGEGLHGDPSGSGSRTPSSASRSR
jgi:hypothetical protein